MYLFAGLTIEAQALSFFASCSLLFCLIHLLIVMFFAFDLPFQKSLSFA